MLTYDEIDRYFIENKIEVCIYGGKSFVYKADWQVKLEKMDDGIKIEIIAKGNSLYHTMFDAYEKFNRVATKGASNLLAPVIEYQHTPPDIDPGFPEAVSKVHMDDEIPF